jgi:hypothetical protein
MTLDFEPPPKMSGTRFAVPNQGYQAVPAAATTKSVQTQGYDAIGLKVSEAAVTTNRRLSIGIIIALVVLTVVVVVSAIYAFGIDRPVQVKEDSLRNKLESKNVEIFLQNGDPLDGGIVCSGTFIRATGEILTAAHCFYTQDPDSCDFVLTPYPHYPTTVDTLR